MRSRHEDTHRYDDMIDLPCHVSRTHPPMPLPDRAAQFAPFAALSGYEDAVKEAGRLTEEELDLSEDSKMVLDRKLALLKKYKDHRPEVKVTFFKPDDRKEGGAYCSITGIIRRIDMYERTLCMEEGLTIAMEQIVQIESRLFDETLS